MASKLSPVPFEELAPDFRKRVEDDLAGGRNPEMNSVMAHHAEFFARYFDFYYPAHEQGVVDARIKELARLKIARLNACPT